MNRERAKRLTNAAVAAATVIIVFLLAVMIFQMARLFQSKRELQELQETKKQYEQLKKDTEDELVLWQEEWKIEEAARKYGYRRNGDG